MSSTVEHIEVAPRMWDKSIAASYTPRDAGKDTKDTTIQQKQDVVSTNDVVKKSVVAAPVIGLLQKIKTYLIPILFVIAVIVVIYVLWKYFTKYRKQRAEAAMEKIVTKEPESSYEDVIGGDTSKYECDSDESDDEISTIPKKNKLTSIEEIDEDDISDEEPPILETQQSKDLDNKEDDDEDDEEDEDDEDDEEDEDDEDDEEDEENDNNDVSMLESDGEIDEEDLPDTKEIEDFIAANTVESFDNIIKSSSELSTDTTDHQENNDPFSIELPVYENEEDDKIKTKKQRRNYKPVKV